MLNPNANAKSRPSQSGAGAGAGVGGFGLSAEERRISRHIKNVKDSTTRDSFEDSSDGGGGAAAVGVVDLPPLYGENGDDDDGVHQSID